MNRVRPPGSGRQKGTPNKRTEEVMELANRLGCNPLEILLRFAMDDWKGLGYAAATTTRYAPDGTPYEVLTIDPAIRVKSASEAAQYLYPKRKAIEHTGQDGAPLFNTLTDLVKSVSNLPKEDDQKH